MTDGTIVNGGFELGADPGVSKVVKVGDSTIFGWTVTKNEVIYYGPYWTAAEGVRSVDISIGGLTQTFTTIPSTEYRVTFSVAGNPEIPGVKELRVWISNQYLDFIFDSTGHSLENMGWVDESFTFVANNTGSTTITFDSLPNSKGSVIDNIRITETEVGKLLGLPWYVTVGIGAAAFILLVRR